MSSFPTFSQWHPVAQLHRMSSYVPTKSVDYQRHHYVCTCIRPRGEEGYTDLGRHGIGGRGTRSALNASICSRNHIQTIVYHLMQERQVPFDRRFPQRTHLPLK